MKPLFLLSLLTLVISDLNAQVGYGPEAGAGLSSMHFAPAIGFTSASTSAIVSWRAGGIIDLPMNRKVYLQSGIFISRKGQNREFSFYTDKNTNESVQQTLLINYVDVPVNVVYKTGLQGKGRFFFGIGVTPSYILGGRNNIKAHGVDSGTVFSNSYNLRIAKGNPLALFDIGVNLCAGYELPTGLLFRGYYTSGVKDLGLATEIDKNRIWGISMAYIFGKHRNINKDADDLIDKTGK